MQNSNELKNFLTLCQDVEGALERAAVQCGIAMATLTDLIDGRDTLTNQQFNKLTQHMRLHSGYTQAAGGGLGQMRVGRRPAPSLPAPTAAPSGPVAVKRADYATGTSVVSGGIHGPGMVRKLISAATVHSAAEYDWGLPDETVIQEPAPSVVRRVAKSLGMGDLGKLASTG